MKKQIIKLTKRIQSMVKQIEDYNDFLNENTYNERGCDKQLSYNVKLHSCYISDDTVETYVDSLNITGDRKEAILQEFNEERLSGIYYHWLEAQQQCFIDDIENADSDKDHPYYNLFEKKEVGFYGRGGGHLCLGSIESHELQITDTELNYYPIWEYKSGEGTSMKWEQDENKLIQELKEFFKVTTQKEVCKNLLADINGDIGSYCKRANEKYVKLCKLEDDIKAFKANANKYLKEFLIGEIDSFIESEYGNEIAIELAEKGDYTQIDSIKEVTTEYVLTTRNAKVNTESAKSMLNAIIKGIDITGRHIDNFTVNKIDKRERDTYVKIGCHLFSLNNTVKQLATV